MEQEEEDWFDVPVELHIQGCTASGLGLVAVPDVHGALILLVIPGSAAARDGRLRAGDVLSEYNG